MPWPRTLPGWISRRKKRQPPGITIITARDNYYYRIRNKTGSGWQVTDYPASGTLALKGLHTDDSCRKKNGEFTWYDEKGRP
jgi:hypothetical protein